MFAITVEWWESVCLELSRNPVAATKTITDFRDSEQALEASKYFLQPATCCSPSAQFQAALILQYVCLKHWSKLSVNEIHELRNTLWTLLHSSLTAGSMPSFAVNKIMQVYALLWKRGWQECDTTSKQQLFMQIKAFMQNHEYMKFGASLLRIVFEEFCSRSSAEIGLPMEFHRIAHNTFELDGLDYGLEISMQYLSISFSILNTVTDDIKNIILAASAVTEASKLIVEVMNWDFGSNEKFSFGLNKENEKEKQRTNDLLNLPRKWSVIFLNELFVNNIFNAYQHLRSLQINFFQNQIVSTGFSSRSSETDVLKIIDVTLSELRLLMTAISSATGTLFAENSDKILMCSWITTRVSPFLMLSLKMPTSVYEKELRSIECVHFGSVILRLLGNFRLSVACVMNLGIFEEMLNSLGSSTFQLSQELSILSDMKLKEIYQCNNNNNNNNDNDNENKNKTVSDDRIESIIKNNKYMDGEGEFNLLEGWRGECLDTLLDAWCMILDDPIMNNNVNENNSSDNNNSNNMISQSIKKNLQETAGRTFNLLFECIMRSTVYEALDSINDNEEEDFSTISNDLLRSICTVGRTNFGFSLLTILR